MEREAFQRPPSEFRPIPFWSWNDDLRDAELRRQIGEMDDQGLGGFFMHSRVGIVTPYLSHEWMDRVRACVDEAKKRGMGAWLYDEDKWPSGFAGGFVTAPDPRHRAKALILRPSPTCYDIAESVATFVAHLSEGRVVRVERLREKPADPLATSPDRLYLHFYVWTAPLGNEWFNSFAYADLLDPETVRTFIATNYEPYAREFGAEFGKAIPGIFTDEPCYLSVHAATPRPRVPWTTALPDAFRTARGYDLLDHLPSLFYDVGDYEAIRYDFWHTLTDRFVESFTKQVGEWCGAHGLAMTGHVLLEDTLFAQTLVVGAAMPHYEYMQLPGMDHLNRNIVNPLTAKQLDSVACQLGGKRTLSELFGCSGQNMSFLDRKWIGDWHLALGINVLNPHLSLYSMRGARKRDFPPNLYYQQPWWTDDHVVEDYFSRLCYALTRGQRAVDLLVVHPIASGWTLFRPEGSHELLDLDARLANLVDTLLELHHDFHLGDDRILAGHAAIDNTNDGAKLTVGDMSYATVLIPAQPVLARSTFELVERFAAAGGRILAIEPVPTRLDGRPAPALADFFASPAVTRIAAGRADLARALAQSNPPPVRIVGTGGTSADSVRYQLRRDGDRFILFLANTDRDRPVDALVSIRATGRLESWDPLTGAVAELVESPVDGWITLPLHFEPAGSHLLVADQRPSVLPPFPAGEEASGSLAGGERSPRTIITPLSDLWRVERLAPNALTLDYCEYLSPVEMIGFGGSAIATPVVDIDPATGWSHSVPVWQADRALRGDVFRNGTAGNWFNVQPGIEQPFAIRFRFDLAPELAAAPGRLALIVETPDRFVITLNGATVPRPADQHWIDPAWRPIDVAALARPGENVVEVRGTFFHDTELESIYVTGDFAVEPVAPDGGPRAFRLVPESAGPRPASHFERQGLPFYAGRLVLGQEIVVDDPAGPVWLDLGQVDATTAAVRVNGNAVGTLVWAPWRFDLTGSMRAGRNLIEVELANSLHNLLGPHHDRRGELRSVSPASFVNEAAWTDRYTFAAFGLAGARLVRPPE